MLRLCLITAIVVASADALVLGVEKDLQICIGSRPSSLALAQAQAVSNALQESSPRLKICIQEIQAKGDHTGTTARAQNIPLAVGAVDFTGLLDEAVLSRQVDIAVHSLKDIPPTARWKEGIVIACHLPREDPSDVLIGPYPTIETLPQNCRVGTSSVRRQAQLMALRPDLELVNLRGNIEARLSALRDQTVDALILAQAGLNRLARHKGGPSAPVYSELQVTAIPPEEMLPGPCQGIVAVVCRSDDTNRIKLLQQINDPNSNIAAAAERSFLDALDTFTPSNYEGKFPWMGRPPLAAFMEKEEGNIEEERGWLFRGLLARPDGTQVLRTSEMRSSEDISIEEAIGIGDRCAQNLLRDAGGDFYL